MWGTGGSSPSSPPCSTRRPICTVERIAMVTMNGAVCGCPDFRMSRRRFLATAGATAGVMTVGSMFGDAFRQVAYGATTGGNVVVVLSCRGGADGLSLVVPRHA